MADCRDLEPLFAPYAEGQADASQQAAVASHLAKCPPCRERIEDEREAHATLVAHRAALKERCQASAGLRRRCAASASAAGPRPAPLPAWFGRRTLVPLSLAATLVLAIGAVFLLGLVGGDVQALANQFALDHVKCFQLAPKHAVVDADVAARDWSKRYDWGLVVPPGTADENLELLDVRRCLSTEGITAHLMYKWRGEPLSVYVLNHHPDDTPDPMHLATRFGPDAVIWTDGGRTYAVVARGRRGDLDRVARYVKTIAR